MNPSLARNWAEVFVRELGIKEPSIDAESVVGSLGLRVLYEKLGGDVSGALIRTCDGGNIVVSRNDSENRKRFTIAHEIAHFHLAHQLFEDGQVHVDRGNFYRSWGSLSADGVDLREIEANQFAASLLMPVGLLRTEVKRLGVRALLDQHVAGLAKRFGVSEQAMTIRLTRLGFL